MDICNVQNAALEDWNKPGHPNWDIFESGFGQVCGDVITVHASHDHWPETIVLEVGEKNHALCNKNTSGARKTAACKMNLHLLYME